MQVWQYGGAELDDSSATAMPPRRPLRRVSHRGPRPEQAHRPAAARRDDIVQLAHAELVHPLATRARAAPTVIARLTPFTGLDVLVQLADALELITPQLQSPERLRDTHQLPCRADVFATRPDVPWEIVSSAVASSVPEPRPVTPLTPALAGRLGLEPYLQAPQPVLCLTVVDDPTDEADHWPPGPPQGHDAAEARRRRRQRRRAISELRRAHRRRRSLIGRFMAWLRSGRIRRQRRRWFARIRHRPLHEQLWSVRPAPDVLLDPACRRWVRDAFALTGADPRRMLLEWEIHWRHADA